MRSHRRIAISYRSVVTSIHEVIEHRLGDHGRDHFRHREIEVLPFTGAISMVQCGKQKKHHPCANREVRPGASDSAWKIAWISRQMAEPRECLGRWTKPDRLRERTVLTEWGARQHDDVGFDLPEVLVSEAVLRQIPDGKILGHDVAQFDQPPRDVLSVRP